MGVLRPSGGAGELRPDLNRLTQLDKLLLYQ